MSRYYYVILDRQSLNVFSLCFIKFVTVASLIHRTSLRVQLLKFIKIDNEHKVQPINRAGQNDRNTNRECCNSLRARNREKESETKCDHFVSNKNDFDFCLLALHALSDFTTAVFFFCQFFYPSKIFIHLISPRRRIEINYTKFIVKKTSASCFFFFLSEWLALICCCF